LYSIKEIIHGCHDISILFRAAVANKIYLYPANPC